MTFNWLSILGVYFNRLFFDKRLTFVLKKGIIYSNHLKDKLAFCEANKEGRRFEMGVVRLRKKTDERVEHEFSR